MRNCGLRRVRYAAAVMTTAALFQLGGCFGTITTTSTISGRDFFVNGLRGLILAPLDALIVRTVDNLFDEEE